MSDELKRTQAELSKDHRAWRLYLGDTSRGLDTDFIHLVINRRIIKHLIRLLESRAGDDGFADLSVTGQLVPIDWPDEGGIEFGEPLKDVVQAVIDKLEDGRT